MATILALTLATAFAPAYVHAFQHVGGAFGSMPSMRVTTPRLTMLSTGLKGNGLVLRSAGIPPLLSPGSVLRSPLRVPITHSKDRFGADVTVKTGTLVTGDNNKPKVNKLLLGFYFLAWYVLNVGYNIYVKKTLNYLALPFTFAVLQLGAGAVWLLPQFLLGIRKVPHRSGVPQSPHRHTALAKSAV